MKKEHITVSELIDELKKYPGHYPVVHGTHKGLHILINMDEIETVFQPFHGEGGDDDEKSLVDGNNHYLKLGEW